MKKREELKSSIRLTAVLLLYIVLTGCASLPPLQSAVARGDIQGVRHHLAGGADINQRADLPLIIATAFNKPAMVKFLIDNGADPNGESTDGDTPLFEAVYLQRIDIVQMLVSAGADPHRYSRYGSSSPQAWAQKKHYTDMIQIFDQAEKRKMAASEAQKAAQAVQAPAAPAGPNAKAIRTDVDTPPAFAPEPRNDAYAVVIGIENYRSIPRSDYSRRDATLVKAYLKSLGFQERNIDLIADEKATKTDIEKSLEAWLPNRVKKDSTVIVYFSGHGAPEPASGDAYLVPYDGDPNYLPVTGYSLKRLYENLGKLEAKEVIVVLDSCFSGSGGRSVLAKGARPLVMMSPAGILAPNIAVLSATQGSQISTSSPDKGHGVFTYYFLKAIKDGKKNIVDIYEQIVPQVEDEAKKLNIEQRPSISPEMEKLKGKFSLRK